MSNFKVKLKETQKKERKGNYISIALISIGVALGFISLYQKNKVLENKIEVLKKTSYTRDSLLRIKEWNELSLNTKISKLEDELILANELLKKNTTGKNDKVDKAINDIEEIIKSKNNTSRFNIRFYSYNPDEKVKARIEKSLSNDFNLKTYPDWKEKPSFFANIPTLFYYSNTTKSDASNIARKLSKETGVKVSVVKGNGFGITKQEREHTFILHYLKSK